MNFTINQYSAAFAIITFVCFVSYKLWCKEKIILSDVVVSIIAGGMLPLATGLTLYSFYPKLIGSIEEMSLQITMTGLVLIYVYVNTIIEKVGNDTS